jgi:hypothetical protein
MDGRCLSGVSRVVYPGIINTLGGCPAVALVRSKKKYEQTCLIKSTYAGLVVNVFGKGIMSGDLEFHCGRYWSTPACKKLGW